MNLIHSSLTYIPATLKENSSWYIEYFFRLPDGNMRRVRININRAIKRFKTKSEKRLYANQQVQEINRKLQLGWTPLVDRAVSVSRFAATSWDEVYTNYINFIEHQEKICNLRHGTKLTYSSFINILNNYNKNGNLSPIKYIYELNHEQCLAFLEWSLNVRKVSFETRDSYRRWLYNFCQWCIEKGYFKENPVENIKSIARSSHHKQKDRDKLQTYYIDLKTREKIYKYLEENDQPLLLASYICSYCFIRPKEMCSLQIKHIRFNDNLIFIPSYISKNETDAYITLPLIVSNQLKKLGYDKLPADYYLFNRQLLPGPLHKPTRGDEIRDRWIIARKILKLSDDIKFYHLKHSGITDMAEQMPEKLVQRQARHHSIEMTERYVQEKAPEAIPSILNFK